MCLAVLVAIATVWNLLPLFAATRTQTEVPDIAARARLFPELGPGLRAIKRDSSGRYYILAAPASTVSVYGTDGKRIGEIPAANSQGVKIVFAEDIDIDATNRLFIADRGANAVKIFKADGSLDTSVAVLAPTSVAALPGNEFAVTSLRSDRLVTIYSEQGKLIRSFGDPRDLPSSADSKRYINHGRLSGDALGFIYFAFTFVPDATIRKYDRFGYSAYEISLPHPDEQTVLFFTNSRGRYFGARSPQSRCRGKTCNQRLWRGPRLAGCVDGDRRSSCRTSIKTVLSPRRIEPPPRMARGLSPARF